MDRGELIRMFVLDDICDDYEEIGHITRNVTACAQRCGLAVSPAEIVEELMSLIDAGLAKAYRLFASHWPVEEFDGRPPLEELEESGGGYTYFWTTESGLELYGSRDDWWPFDEDDQLGKDWSLSE